MSETLIWINRSGQEFGPYTLEDAKTYLRSGQIVPSDLACASSDNKQWVPVSQVLGIAPPPPPQSTFDTAIHKWWHGPPLIEAHPIVSAVLVVILGLLFHSQLVFAILLLFYSVISLRAKRWIGAVSFLVAALILVVCKLLAF